MPSLTPERIQEIRALAEKSGSEPFKQYQYVARNKTLRNAILALLADREEMEREIERLGDDNEDHHLRETALVEAQKTIGRYMDRAWAAEARVAELEALIREARAWINGENAGGEYHWRETRGSLTARLIIAIRDAGEGK